MYQSLKNIKVLLAEDEKKLSKLMKDAIGEYFQEFIVVDNGEKVLKVYKKHKPDILITDILMPKLDGLELLKKLREKSEKLPIIILSAHSDTEKLLKAIEYGATRYFIKPLDPDDLLDYLSTLTKKLEERKSIALLAPFFFSSEKKLLYLNNEILKLTKREIDFISLLLNEPDYIANNELIKKSLWSQEEVSNERLRTFIRRLRNKTSKELIKSNSSLGYSITLAL
jgi:DNA-binding response OmpR family regulator